MRLLFAIVLLIGVGCGSSKQGSPTPSVEAGVEHQPADADADADADASANGNDARPGDALPASDASSPLDTIGRSYECLPPPGDGGSTAATCVIGQSYCLATRARPSNGTPASAHCNDVPALCAANPTCSCIMPTPNVSCSCAGSDGFVIVTCDSI